MDYLEQFLLCHFEVSKAYLAGLIVFLFNERRLATELTRLLLFLLGRFAFPFRFLLFRLLRWGLGSIEFLRRRLFFRKLFRGRRRDSFEFLRRLSSGRDCFFGRLFLDHSALHFFDLRHFVAAELCSRKGLFLGDFRRGLFRLNDGLPFVDDLLLQQLDLAIELPGSLLLWRGVAVAEDNVGTIRCSWAEASSPDGRGGLCCIHDALRQLYGGFLADTGCLFRLLLVFAGGKRDALPPSLPVTSVLHANKYL